MLLTCHPKGNENILKKNPKIPREKPKSIEILNDFKAIHDILYKSIKIY